MRFNFNKPVQQIEDINTVEPETNNYGKENANFFERFDATGQQLSRNVQKGIYGTLEGVVDLGTNIVAGVGQLFGANTQKIQDFAKRDLTEEFLSSKVGRILGGGGSVYGLIKVLTDPNYFTKDYLDNLSFVSELSPKTQDIILGVEEGVGQLALLAATAGVGDAAGLSEGAIQAINMSTIGTSAAGRSSTEALNEGKTIGEALAYGAMSGAVEVGVEMISGGISNNITKVPALTNVGSKLANLATNNRILQVALQALGDAAGEGAEEMVSEILDPLLKRAAYMEDEGIDNATIEEVFTAGLIGSLTSLVASGSQVSLNLNNNILNNIENDINNTVRNYRTSQRTDTDTQIYNENLNKYRTELEQKLNNLRDGGQSYIERMQSNGNRLYQNYDFENRRFNDNSFNNVTQIKTVDTSSLIDEEINSQDVQDILALENRANQKNGLANNIIIEKDLGSVSNGSQINGYIDTNGDIHVNLSSSQAPLETLMHEMSHAIENTIGYQVLKTSLFSEQDINNKVQEIKSKYEGLENVDLESEAIATLMQENFGDSEYVNMLYQKEPSVFRKIYNWLKSFIKGEHKTKLEKEQEKLVRSYLKTFEQAIEESKNIDTDKKFQYNVDEEVNENARNQRTNQRTDEFRRIQEESLGMYDKDVSEYHEGKRKINETLRTRLSRAFKLELHSSRSSGNYTQRTLLNPKTSNNVIINENIDGDLFHDIFEINRKYLTFGELVDLHDNYDDATCYLSDDGLSGFAITRDGDLISVFNLSKDGGFLKTIAPIVKEKAKTLDCYVSPLQPLNIMYSKIFGFKTASIMDYNMKHDHDDIAKNHNMPQVAFMVNTTQNVVTKHFTKDQDAEAFNYQQSYVRNETKYSLSEKQKLVEEIKKNKYTNNIESWKYFASLNLQELKLINKYSKGTDLTYDEIMSMNSVQKAEEYLDQHPRLKPNENPELVQKTKEEFRDVLLKEAEKRGGAKKEHKAFFAVGLPGAGKSSTGLDNFLKNGYIEFDNDIAKGVPCLAKYYDGGLGAGVVQDIVSQAQLELWDEFLKEGYNIAYPCIGKRYDKLCKEILRLKDYGYDIENPNDFSIGYVYVDLNTSLTRATTRFLQTGRFVDPNYILTVGLGPEHAIQQLMKEGVKNDQTNTAYRVEVTKYVNGTNNSEGGGIRKSEGVRTVYDRKNKEFSERSQFGGREGLSNESDNEGTLITRSVRNDLNESETNNKKYSLSKDTKELLEDNRTKTRIIKLLQQDSYKQNKAYNKLLDKYNKGQLAIQDLMKEIRFKDAVIAIAEAKYDVETKQLTKENRALIKEVEQEKANAWELVEELNIWTEIAEIRREDVKSMEEMAKVYNRVNSKFKEIKQAKATKSFNPNIASSSELAPFVQLGVNILGKMTRGANISANTKNVIGEYLTKFYNQDNPLLGSYYDSELAMQMDEFARSTENPNHGIKTAGNVKINLDNLKMLEKVYSGFMKIANDYGKVLHDNKTVEAKEIVNNYSSQVIKMADNAYKADGSRKIMPSTSRYIFETSKADTIARTFDGTIGDEKGFVGDVLEQIKQSENKVNKNIMDLNFEMDEFIKQKGNKQYIRDIQNINSKQSVNLKGQLITKDTAMYIYLLSLREQARSHFMSDVNPNAQGIVIRTGKGEYLTTLVVTQKDIDALYDRFNEKDLEFIKIAQNMFKNAAALKAETDLARYGYTNATDNNYVPIVNDVSNRMPRLAASENRILDTILNLSFNKDTVKNATSKIYGVGLSQVFNKHIDQVSKYNGGMQTLESIQMLMRQEIETPNGKKTNLWNELNRKSSNFDKWFNNLITDVYQVRTYDDYSNFFDKLRSNYAAATLGINFKVLGTQFTGIITSLSELSPSSLIKGMGNLKDFNAIQTEMEENCTFIKHRKYNKEFVRSQGNYDGRLSNFSNKLTAGIERVDNLTIHMIWQACKYEVEKTKGLRFGTKENIKEASILAEKIVRKTQDNHNPLDTPTIKRSGNDFVKSMLMFTTQPFQMLNIIYNDVAQINNYHQRLNEFKGKPDDYVDAFGKTKQDVLNMKSKLSKQTARDFTVIIANNMAYALVAMLFKQWLGKDDKKKEFAEEVSDEFISSMISILPITSKIYTIAVDNYSISDTPINYIEDVVKSITTLTDNPTKTNFYNAAKNISTLFGVPTKNLMDYLYATINTFNSSLAYKFKNIYYDQPISTDKKIITDYISTNESLSKTAFSNYLRKRGLDNLPKENVNALFDYVKEDINNLDDLSIPKLEQGSTIKVSDDLTNYIITKKDEKAYEETIQTNVNKLLTNQYYNQISDKDTKLKAVKKVMEVSKYLTIMKNNNSVKLSNNRLANISKYFNFDVSELVSYYYYLRELKASIKGDNKKTQILVYINSLRGLTTSQKLALVGLAGYDLSDTDTNRVKLFLQSSGIFANNLQDQIISVL